MDGKTADALQRTTGKLGYTGPFCGPNGASTSSTVAGSLLLHVLQSAANRAEEKRDCNRELQAHSNETRACRGGASTEQRRK